jgi:hypothetical protein
MLYEPRPLADNQSVTESPRPTSIIRGWLLWGAAVGAVILVVAYVSVMVFGVVDGWSELSPVDLGRSALGLLALPAFALEGAVGGMVVGGLVGVSSWAANRLRGGSPPRDAPIARTVAAALFGFSGAAVIGYSFDVAGNTPGIELTVAEWTWTVIFGLLVAMTSYRASSRVTSR